MNTSGFRAAFDAQLIQHGQDLVIRPNQWTSLERYYELLRRWNRRINLTALDVERYSGESFDRLLIEPLLAARHIDRRPTHWIDVGSGGGSPAIPMRLTLLSGSLAMVESKGRKVAFLREAVRALELGRTAVLQSRFELLADVSRADLITLRAVKVDPVVESALDKLLAPGGHVAVFGSSRPEGDLGFLQLETMVSLVPGSWLGVYRRN